MWIFASLARPAAVQDEGAAGEVQRALGKARRQNARRAHRMRHVALEDVQRWDCVKVTAP